MNVEDKEAKQQILFIATPMTEKISDEDVEVVLLNMGGPKTNHDVKAFQKRLFEDPLLIRFPLSFLLQKIFAWLLVTLRLEAVKERYRLMGLKDGGSPIYQSMENQTRALAQELRARGCRSGVSYSFNYSPPYPEDTIEDLKKKNKKYILPISLYPHYSKATTGSNLTYLKKAAKQNYPSLKFLNSPSYHLEDGYINAFVDRIKQILKEGEMLDDFYLAFSAHGLPVYFLTEGDPYPFLISQTVAKVLAKLNRTQNWCICYQSAVGPFQWLKPSTDDVIKALARRSKGKVIMVPIAFVGDHIETICEIDMEYRKMANDLGIKDYRMTKALETHPGFISALADTVFSALNRPATVKSTQEKVFVSV